ncbi:class F sortase [Streptomyces scabiei]|nr:class F sortase [Streptomyces sp. LBUM 1484]MBP5873981.1 class F sortase [Streptomyces sp. LBUM 1477]MBP5881698.1 class F sortase [Streptomyces sp. LBUM 1487]QTU44259.1 class F sortase [Streptomyces sp. LBUM 1482]QTU60403.1 class F sortase [Streptomyces sp. LBUM 1475]
MEPRYEPCGPSHPSTPSAKYLAYALLAGMVLVITALRGEGPPQPSTAQSFSPVAPGPSSTASTRYPFVSPLPASAPVRLRIPAIGVNAPMTKLGLDDTGALRPPSFNMPHFAGWYGAGTPPGSVGTAVATGHVDTPQGPGVFHRLGALAKGDTIEIIRSDRRTAVFTVDAVELYDKKAFPDEKVYGSSHRPELRVITCGGPYAEETGYQGNVVVFATLTAA